MGMLEDTIFYMIQRYTNKETYPEEWNLKALKDHVYDTFGITISLPEDVTHLTIEQLQNDLLDKTREGYLNKEKEFSAPLMREIEKMILLRIVDREWKDHLKRLDDLKQGIGLRAYGQKDPLTEYHFEAHNMFQNMVENIKEETIKFVYRVKVKQRPQRIEDNQEITLPKEDYQGTANIQSKQKKNQDKKSKRKKIGRNDPCPCGSGKKYKYCCGKNK
jgi:preprotein translocase subunit SecA